MKRGVKARVCVIGAGPSGITAIKHLLQAGLRDIVCYERGGQVGGNWVYTPDEGHSSVYETTHIISSRRYSQYHDFPMPDDYPDYPSHQQLLRYFQDYARHFGVEPFIRFNTEVRHAALLPDERWRVTLADGTVQEFDHLMVASGHHWDPRMPQYPGTFSGELLHSHTFKNNLPFRNQRVLVIGGGNSACDIAVETGRVSAFTAISWRRGYYIVPKVILGLPPDVINAKFTWMPRALYRRAIWLTWWLSTGGNRRYGLPAPDHSILSSHPVANSELLYFIKHGRVHYRPEIARFDGSTVHFVDGRAEPYDVIVAATGYRISHPFFDRVFLDFSEGTVPLYLRVFHPDHPSLTFIGLVQPQGCIWPLSDTQAQLVANYIAGRYELPADIHARVQADVARIRRRFQHAARHTIEVEYHQHQDELFRELPPGVPRVDMRKQKMLGQPVVLAAPPQPVES